MRFRDELTACVCGSTRDCDCRPHGCADLTNHPVQSSPPHFLLAKHETLARSLAARTDNRRMPPKYVRGRNKKPAGKGEPSKGACHGSFLSPAAEASIAHVDEWPVPALPGTLAVNSCMSICFEPTSFPPVQKRARRRAPMALQQAAMPHLSRVRVRVPMAQLTLMPPP